MSGPVKQFAPILGATGEHAGECVLKQFLPPGFKPQAIFPVSDMEATAKPLAKGRYKPDLHVALIDCSQSEREFRNLAAPRFPENHGVTIIIEF